MPVTIMWASVAASRDLIECLGPDSFSLVDDNEFNDFSKDASSAQQRRFCCSGSTDLINMRFETPQTKKHICEEQLLKRSIH